MAAASVLTECAPRQCRYCDRGFKPKTGDRTTYCSRGCSFAYRRAHRKYASKAEARRAETQRAKASRRHHATQCQSCGVPFTPLRGGVGICSDECGAQRARSLSRSHYMRTRSPTLVEHTCADGQCRKLFHGKPKRTYCSGRCLKRVSSRVSKALRRARLQGAPRWENVDPFTVFWRDQWCCYLCHMDTPMRLRGTTHPQAPELEHIVPVSLGGEHTYANTACACRRCNHLKGVMNANDYKGMAGASPIAAAL